MDLCGDDWDLMTLMNIGGETTSALLQQQASRADGLRPDIKQAAEILSGKTQKTKKRGNESITAMNLPQRIPTLLVGGEQAMLPTWRQKRIPRVSRMNWCTERSQHIIPLMKPRLITRSLKFPSLSLFPPSSLCLK